MIDYIAIMQDYFNRGKPDDRLFLTDIPTSISLSEDAIIKVRYDAKNAGYHSAGGTLTNFPRDHPKSLIPKHGN